MTDRIIVVTTTEECPHFIPDSTRVNADGVDEMFAECALVSSMECQVHSTMRGDGACKCEDPFPEGCMLDKRIHVNESNRISIDLKDRVMKWAKIIENNMNNVRSIRRPALEGLVVELREFTEEEKFTIIFFDDAKIEPCPKCDYERGRVYRWLGRWYFMCHNCALGIPEPALIDWGVYGKLNEREDDES